MNTYSNLTIAQTALALLQTGIEFKSRDKIKAAYALVEAESFSWDNLDSLFLEFDALVSEANVILLTK